MGENVIFSEKSKLGCQPAWNIFFQLGDYKISEKKTTNSKRVFQSVKTIHVFIILTQRGWWQCRKCNKALKKLYHSFPSNQSPENKWYIEVIYVPDQDEKKIFLWYHHIGISLVNSSTTISNPRHALYSSKNDAEVLMKFSDILNAALRHH